MGLIPRGCTVEAVLLAAIAELNARQTAFLDASAVECGAIKAYTKTAEEFPEYGRMLRLKAGFLRRAAKKTRGYSLHGTRSLPGFFDIG